MACVDMFNNEHNNNGRYAPTMSPRISFSNDFIDTQQQMITRERTPQPPSSSDFEFSVTNYKMMAADELFSKGRLLPFKDSCTTNKRLQKLTLREELLVDDNEDTGRTVSSSRPPKGSSRWKELLGLKRPHILSKKGDKSDDGSIGKLHEETHGSKNSQLRDGGSNCGDVEIGM